MRVHSVAIALALLGLGAAAEAQVAQGSATAPVRSATTARDIGGFALGMRIKDANKIAQVVSLGNDNFQATREGIAYDFGVTRLGRIYRVSSSQNLGRFGIDKTFLETLAARLSAKYGPPTDRSKETFGWSLIERVTDRDGRTLPFTTMWASAYVNSSADGVSLEIKLLDFRIMWADEAKLNRAPRDKAARSLDF